MCPPFLLNTSVPIIKGYMIENVYMINLDDVSMHGAKYLVAKNEASWLWHKRSTMCILTC